MTEQEIADFCVKNKIKKYKKSDENMHFEIEFDQTAFWEKADIEAIVEKLKEDRKKNPAKVNKFRL